jgi:hypothetical protein
MKVILVLVSAALFLLQSFSSVTACDGHGHDHSHDDDTHKTSKLRTSKERQLTSSNVSLFEVCGFQEPSAKQIAVDVANMEAWMNDRASKSLRAALKTYALPVYFHIIQPSATTGIVDDTRVAQHMTYLNNAFSKSNTPFVFQYINVTRTINPAWSEYVLGSNVETAYKTLLKVGGKDSLNVYIVNQVTNDNGAIVSGYAYLPDANSNTNVYDGVVLTRGTDDRRLNTLVHETVCVTARSRK